MQRLLTLTFLICLILANTLFGQSVLPYIKTFTATQTINVTNSADLTAKLTSALQAGTRLLLTDGVTYNGNFTIENDTPDVMIDCEGNCIITGNFVVDGARQWVKRLHIKTDSFDLTNRSVDSVVVNNVFEGPNNQTKVGLFMHALLNPQSSQVRVVYGNIFWGWQQSHYLQNTAPSTGYFVNNFYLEDPSCGNCHNVQVYTQTANQGEKIQFLKNIFVSTSENELLFGGENAATPLVSIVISNNVFFNFAIRDFVQPSLDIPTVQYELTNNYLLRTRVDHDLHWGRNDSCFSYPSTNTKIRSNVWMNQLFPAHSIRYYIARQTGIDCNVEQFQQRLLTTDDVDLNEYHPGFRAEMKANGNSEFDISLPAWRTFTANQGKEYDTNSTAVIGFNDGYRLNQSEYDTKIANLIVWSFNLNSTVDVPFIKTGKLYDPKNPYGSSVMNIVVGTNHIPLNNGQEFGRYLVKYD